MSSVIEKIPPQSLEAEQSLLGSIMIDGESMFKVSDFLQTRDFYKRAHQDIYEAIFYLFEKKQAIDLLSVSSRLEEKKILKEVGGKNYLAELVNCVPTASHVVDYARIVQKKRVLRDLIRSGQEIASSAYDEAKDIEKLLDDAESKIFSISQKSRGENFVHIKDSLEEAFERIERLSQDGGETRGISTGFTDIDNILSGLQKSDLIILAARPSMGKSSLASNIAKNVAINYKIPVGLFSLEMSIDQIVDRLIADISGINLWKLRTGKLKKDAKDSDFDRIRESFGVLSSAPLYIDDSFSFNIMQMRTMARRLQSDKGLGLIVVDYLQLIEPKTSNASSVQQMTEISRELKSLAKELNVPILALSQLSRAPEQRTPQIPRLSDLRESGCLTGDALIHRSDTGEMVPIRSLVGQTNIPTYSLNEEYQLSKTMISRVFSSGRKKVYQIKTKSGYEIKASANHPFWRVSGWTRLDELKAGDHIATPKKLEITNPQDRLSKDEIILIAHLLGDGCILPRQPYHYTSADKKNINVVTRTANNLFGIKKKIVKQENWWHAYLSSPYPLARGKHHPITNWFKKLDIERVRSWEKRIPKEIFSLSDKKISLFLKHLWATDGHIGYREFERKNNKKGKLATIYYGTTSKKMATEVKYLLLRLGIRSKISMTKKENYRPSYSVNIRGTSHQLNFLEMIGCFGDRGKIVPSLIKRLKKIKQNTNLDVWPKETWQFFINPIRKEKEISWREFSKNINTSYCGSTLTKAGIGTERMKRIAQCLESPVVINMAEANIFWDEIMSITPLGVEEVFDATVPGLHSFIANGIIVENSIEQDADVVMFIYREDYYREDTSRRNIADIIIAKHRNGPVGKVELYFDKDTASFKNLDKTH